MSGLDGGTTQGGGGGGAGRGVQMHKQSGEAPVPNCSVLSLGWKVMEGQGTLEKTSLALSRHAFGITAGGFREEAAGETACVAVEGAGL